MLKFKNELQLVNWLETLETKNNVNENFDAFAKTLKITLDKCIPKQKIKICKTRKLPWLTMGIKKSCLNKRLYRLFLTQTSNETLKKHYKLYEKILKKTVQKAKKIRNAHKFKKSNNKMKTTWQIINSENRNNNSKIKQNIALEINNRLCQRPKEVANAFNHYFSQIGNSDRILSSCNPKSNVEKTECVAPVINSLYLRPAALPEIVSIIKSLKNKTSHGIDEIPPVLVKQCVDVLALPYTTLINQSFSEEVFPDALKIAITKPIHKKGQKKDPTNYRPIALLTTSSKIFESAMCRRLCNFFEKYKIYDDNQNGFRKNHSTTLAVYKCLQKFWTL